MYSTSMLNFENCSTRTATPSALDVPSAVTRLKRERLTARVAVDHEFTSHIQRTTDKGEGTRSFHRRRRHPARTASSADAGVPSRSHQTQPATERNRSHRPSLDKRGSAARIYGAVMSNAAIQEAKSRIVEVIGERLELRQKGRIYYALCPFHADRHPSLNVNPAKLAWFCNVCNLGGDVFSFLMKFHGTDFKGALAILGLNENLSREEKHRLLKQKSVLTRISRDEAAHLDLHNRKYDALCALSRDYHSGRLKENNPLATYGLDAEAYFKREFEIWEKERELIKEVFSDRKKEVRGAL